jgi:RNA polymerase sigma factor (sigma-70 family)
MAGKPGADTALHRRFRALADHILRYRFWPDEPDPSLEFEIAEKALLKLDQFRGDSRISTWVYRIAQNEATDELNKRNREQDRRSLLEQPRADGNASGIAHDIALELADLQRTLPAEQAEVVALKQQGDSLTKIAEKLAEPLGTIRSRWRLAKQKLRGKPKEQEPRAE